MSERPPESPYAEVKDLRPSYQDVCETLMSRKPNLAIDLLRSMLEHTDVALQIKAVRLLYSVEISRRVNPGKEAALIRSLEKKYPVLASSLRRTNQETSLRKRYSEYLPKTTC